MAKVNLNTGLKICRATESHAEPVELPASEFMRRPQNIDGLDGICRACRRARRVRLGQPVTGAQKRKKLTPEQRRADKRKQRERFRNKAANAAFEAISKSANGLDVSSGLDSLQAVTEAMGGSKHFGVLIADELRELPNTASKVRLMLDILKLQLRTEDLLRDNTPDSQLTDEMLDAKLMAAMQRCMEITAAKGLALEAKSRDTMLLEK